MAEFLSALEQNKILIATMVAWLLAQILKTGTAYWRNRRFQAERLVGAGGMPSSHTALVVSLACSIGWREGWDTPLFALSVVLAGIVMYDAAGVRRAAGRQARVLNKLMQELRVEHTIRDTRLKELLGHTPLEVLAGALLGVVIAYLFKSL